MRPPVLAGKDIHALLRRPSVGIVKSSEDRSDIHGVPSPSYRCCIEMHWRTEQCAATVRSDLDTEMLLRAEVAVFGMGAYLTFALPSKTIMAAGAPRSQLA
jgi:hypothetical protein